MPPPYEVVKIVICVAELNENVASSATPWFASVPLVVTGPDKVPKLVVVMVTALDVAAENDARTKAVRLRRRNVVFMLTP